MKQTVETICLLCHERCFVKCDVENGKLVTVRDDPACEKGVYMADILHHPDRLKYPLKAKGKKGTGQWEQISWDKALDLMAKKFTEIKDRDGSWALASGITSHHRETVGEACHTFIKIFDSPHLLDGNYQCSQCNCPSDFFTYGEWGLWETRGDWANSKCIVIWGANPVDTRPLKWRAALEAQRKGAKLIVVDPRYTESAKQADIWLKIRPQSDGALALAWLHVMINEGLYDKKFVAEQCTGFEELKERVSTWTPERAAEITWIPAEQIVNAARTYGRIRPSMFHTRLGVDGQQLCSTGACMGITDIVCIKGDLDSQGGNILHTPDDIKTAPTLGGREYLNTMGKGFKNIYYMFRNWRRTVDLDQRRPGYREYPVYCGPPEISWFNYNSWYPGLLDMFQDGRVKGVFLPGCNPMVHGGNPKRIRKALLNLEFLVVSDIFMTPTAALADLVLPVAHVHEYSLINHTLFGAPGAPYGNSLVATPKVVDPPGEAWPDMKIIIELAKRVGYKLPFDSLESLYAWQLETVGVTFDEMMALPQHHLIFGQDFKKYQHPDWKWNTPTGKIELYNYTYKKLNQDPLPYYKEDPVSPLTRKDIYEEYPLIVGNHRVRFY